MVKRNKMETNKSKIKRMLKYIDGQMNNYEEEFIDDRYQTLGEIRNEFSLILAVDKKILEKPTMSFSERIRKMTAKELKHKRAAKCPECKSELKEKMSGVECSNPKCNYWFCL